MNGGAFAVARLLPLGVDIDGASAIPAPVMGGLSLESLAIGASVFTIAMCVDIWMFARMMRTEYFGGTTVFGTAGKLVLTLIGALIVAGWLLAAFG